MHRCAQPLGTRKSRRRMACVAECAAKAANDPAPRQSRRTRRYDLNNSCGISVTTCDYNKACAIRRRYGRRGSLPAAGGQGDTGSDRAQGRPAGAAWVAGASGAAGAGRRARPRVDAGRGDPRNQREPRPRHRGAEGRGAGPQPDRRAAHHPTVRSRSARGVLLLGVRAREDANSSPGRTACSCSSTSASCRGRCVRAISRITPGRSA